MAHTYRLEAAQFVPRPLAEVFGFFSDVGNLEAITPARLKFQILTPQPVIMQAGAVIEYRLQLAGIPFRWKTVIESYEPMRRFTDVQAKGPYKLWHHTHEFYQSDGGVVVVDRVRYQLPLRCIGRLAHVLFVRRQLESIFEYRRRMIEQIFGKS